MPSSARAAPSTALAARSRAGRGTLALVVGARTAWARPRQPRAADNRPRRRSCKLRCRLRSLVRDGVALALSAFSKITVFPLSPSPVVGTSEHGCLGCKTSHACARNTKQKCGDRHKQRAMLYHQQVSLWGAVLSMDAGMPHPPERWLATQPPPSHAHPTHARHVTAQADSQKRR